MTLQITDDFELSGIALGTILVIAFYHLVGSRRPPGSNRGSEEVTKAL